MQSESTIVSSPKTSRNIVCTSLRRPFGSVGLLMSLTLRANESFKGMLSGQRQAPPSVPAIIGDRFKAKIVVMITHERVPGCWNVLSQDRFHAPRPCQYAKAVQNQLLDAPLQNSATHQPRIDDQAVARYSGEQHGNQSVITESVV